MTNIEAKLKVGGQTFGILVDSAVAMAVKEGRTKIGPELLATTEVFSDIKKGMRAGANEVMNAFGTNDIYKIAERIMKNGEIQIPADYKNKQREDKIKQVIDFVSRNAVDPKSGRPHTSERVKTAMEQCGVNVDNRPIEEQITHILDKLKVVLPLKMETKKLKITIPASYSGRAYSIVKDLKEKEEWLDNGDLLCIVNVPAGMQMDFYDKLNGATHGASIVEEMK